MSWLLGSSEITLELPVFSPRTEMMCSSSLFSIICYYDLSTVEYSALGAEQGVTHALTPVLGSLPRCFLALISLSLPLSCR